MAERERERADSLAGNKRCCVVRRPLARTFVSGQHFLGTKLVAWLIVRHIYEYCRGEVGGFRFGTRRQGCAYFCMGDGERKERAVFCVWLVRQ